MTWSTPAYFAGLLTPFVAVLLVVLALNALSTGLSIECGRCGYSTGDRKTTTHVVARARWFWHKHVGRRIGRCHPLTEEAS